MTINPVTTLALIAMLFEQLEAAHRQIADLQAQLAAVGTPPPPDPTQ